jgi:hypothetical protein
VSTNDAQAFLAIDGATNDACIAFADVGRSNRIDWAYKLQNIDGTLKHTYKGAVTARGDKEVLLVFDRTNNTCTMHRLNTQLAVKQSRYVGALVSYYFVCVCLVIYCLRVLNRIRN